MTFTICGCFYTCKVHTPTFGTVGLEHTHNLAPAENAVLGNWRRRAVRCRGLGGWCEAPRAHSLVGLALQMALYEQTLFVHRAGGH